MPGPKQKIKTVLIPEIGLNLAPEFIEQSVVDPDFSRVFSHLVGKAEDRGILIRATPDGSLRVVSAGVPFVSYLVISGTAADAFTTGNTKEYTVAYNVSDFLIETFAAIISFQNQQGTWLPEKILPVGYHSIDFIFYGFKIRNRNSGSNCVFEITIYR